MENDPRPSPAAPGPSWASLLLPFALILGFVLLLSLNAGNAAPAAPRNVLEEYLKMTAGYIAIAAEIAAGLVIGVGVLNGVVSYFKHFIQGGTAQADSTEAIRLRLGRVLALGLEFTVASDILRTAVAPTRQDILNLGAIVMLRTLLNYFLEHEIRQAEARKEARPQQINE